MQVSLDIIQINWKEERSHAEAIFEILNTVNLNDYIDPLTGRPEQFSPGLLTYLQFCVSANKIWFLVSSLA